MLQPEGLRIDLGTSLETPDALAASIVRDFNQSTLSVDKLAPLKARIDKLSPQEAYALWSKMDGLRALLGVRMDLDPTATRDAVSKALDGKELAPALMPDKVVSSYEEAAVLDDLLRYIFSRPRILSDELSAALDKSVDDMIDTRVLNLFKSLLQSGEWTPSLDLELASCAEPLSSAELNLIRENLHNIISGLKAYEVESDAEYIFAHIFRASRLSYLLSVLDGKIHDITLNRGQQGVSLRDAVHEINPWITSTGTPPIEG